MDTLRKNKFNKAVNITLWSIIALLIIGISYNYYKKFNPPIEKVYCHYEKITTDDLPRKECGNLAIVTKDMDKVDTSSFLRVVNNSYCTKKFSELVWCSTEEEYFSEYPLQIFSKNETVDGVICMAYMVEFLNGADENFTVKKDLYEQMFAMEKFNATDQLKERLSECKRRTDNG